MACTGKLDDSTMQNKA